MSEHLLGIDTGGTFTDFAYLYNNQLITHKRLSTPEAPEQAIFEGLAALGLDALCAAGQLTIIHGTTVATNAALEGRGAKTAYVCNQGLGDVLSIGRQNRADLYSLTPTKEL
jgi:N-methylhydantoinase A